MSFEAVKKIYSQDLFSESSTAKERLGTVRELEDGRKFVYARAGSSALAVGKLMQGPVPEANHKDCVVAATAAIGAKKVTATLGATAAAADLYKDGYMHVNDATGEGALYKIKGHAAVDSGGVITVHLYDALRVALPITTCQVTFTKSPYDGVDIHPSPPTATPVGVTPRAVTALYYFWLQTKGICACLTDGTVVIGNDVMASNAVDGAVEDALFVLSEGTPNTVALANMKRIGNVISVNVDTEYSLINLY